MGLKFPEIMAIIFVGERETTSHGLAAQTVAGDPAQDI
jgi:hypothetical protein